MDQPAPAPSFSFRDWLNGLKDWQFTLVLYLLRWAIILPLGYLLSPLSTSGDNFHPNSSDPLTYLLPIVFFDPAVETFIECVVPYWVMYGIVKRQPQSPWPFVIISVLIMVALHPLTPLVFIFTTITGSFLAFVYGHFASKSQMNAFLHTTAFHAGINIVGWTGIFLQSIA